MVKISKAQRDSERARKQQQAEAKARARMKAHRDSKRTR